MPAAAAAAVLAAPAVSGSRGGRGSRGSRGGRGGRVAWAGGLVGEFSSLYSLFLTTHMLIFARRVCSGASPVPA